MDKIELGKEIENEPTMFSNESVVYIHLIFMLFVLWKIFYVGKRFTHTHKAHTHIAQDNKTKAKRKSEAKSCALQLQTRRKNECDDLLLVLATSQYGNQETRCMTTDYECACIK